MLLRAELLGGGSAGSSGAFGGGGSLAGLGSPDRQLSFGSTGGNGAGGDLLGLSSPGRSGGGGGPGGSGGGFGFGGNLFRYMSGGEIGGTAGPPAGSPYAVSPVGEEGPLGACLASPRRPPRKIARSPFKVLDAPALQVRPPSPHVGWAP